MEEIKCDYVLELRRMSCDKVIQKYNREQEEKRKLEEKKDQEYRQKQLQNYLKGKR